MENNQKGRITNESDAPLPISLLTFPFFVKKSSNIYPIDPFYAHLRTNQLALPILFMKQ